MSRWLWRHIEPWIIKGLPYVRPVIKTLRTDSVVDTELYRRFDSRQELERLIEQSGDVLSASERKVIVHGLKFGEVSVRDVMTPRAAIDSIKKDEFLGPLVLSELHDIGHSRLPVINGDLDHVVGVLHLRDLLSLNNKESATAEKVMDPKVYYIHEDDHLEHALAAFIKTRRHLFIVINEQRETVGLLSLEDVIETLIGRKIMDEDDNHEDLRAIAKQRGAHNNTPEGHIDL
jgi:CBS domain containing-hemolysin-like protein